MPAILQVAAAAPHGPPRIPARSELVPLTCTNSRSTASAVTRHPARFAPSRAAQRRAEGSRREYRLPSDQNCPYFLPAFVRTTAGGKLAIQWTAYRIARCRPMAREGCARMAPGGRLLRLLHQRRLSLGRMGRLATGSG